MSRVWRLATRNIGVATVRKSELKGKYHIYIEYQNDGENVLVDTVEEQEWNE